MHLNKKNRLRRIRKARMRMQEKKVVRLVVHRTPRHIYAQIIDDKHQVLTNASTLEADLRSQATGNKAAASRVGALIAERALHKGLQKVAFDRSGFKYHGRIQALADSARKGGLLF